MIQFFPKFPKNRIFSKIKNFYFSKICIIDIINIVNIIHIIPTILIISLMLIPGGGVLC